MIVSRMARPKAISTEMERMIREQFGGWVTASGVSVTNENALRLLTVYNCVKVLYNCVSQMPCQLMKETEDGFKSKAKKHSLYKVIGKRPNRWMTAPEFWGMAIVHVSLRGNFYAFKVMGPDKKVRELLPIHADRVRKVTQHPDWSITYEIARADGTGTDEWPQSKIMHLRGLSMDGLVGLNAIEKAARDKIGLGLASEQFLSQYFGKGMHPGAVLKHPQVLSSSAYATLKKQFEEKYSGLGKSHNFMLLDEAMDIVFPTIKLVDAQFIEQEKLTEAQICGMFGVPLMLVQAGDNPATYASATEFKRTFVDLVLAPIMVNFESAIDRDCLTEEDQETYYTKYNLNSLLRGNITERFAAYATAIDKEFMNPNECRALEDMNPYLGGEVYRTRTSSMKDTGTKKGDANNAGQEAA
jgi:HK97 family phage portal protein